MNQVQPQTSDYKLKKRNSLECTCELNRIKAVGKKNLRYSMCDICSERLFSKIKSSNN